MTVILVALAGVGDESCRDGVRVTCGADRTTVSRSDVPDGAVSPLSLMDELMLPIVVTELDHRVVTDLR